MAKQIPLPKKYPIPENWKWVEMEALTFMRCGFPFDSGKFSDEKAGRKPLIRIRDVVRGETATYTDEDCPDEYVIHCGDVLIGMDGDFNVAKWKSEDALLNQRVCCICTASNALLNDYLFYYLPSPLKKINNATPSVTVKHLSTKTLGKTSIPLPPLAEQQRIVDRIESLFAKLDEAKEKAQAVVDGFEDRKAMILHKAFTGTLTNCKEQLKTVYITDVIKHEKNALKAGPFGSSLRKDMYVSGGYKVYGQEQVISGDERIGDYFIDEEKYQELNACKISPRDVLISLVGTVGKVLVLSDDCKPGIINPRLIKVSLDESKMLPLFFKYYFESGYLKTLYKSESHGTTMDVLNMGILKKLPFPLFEIDKQKEIIEILKNVIEKEERVKEIAEQVIDQIDEMKKAILARAFRGELGTNDPSDESAEELLKRIL